MLMYGLNGGCVDDKTEEQKRQHTGKRGVRAG